MNTNDPRDVSDQLLYLKQKMILKFHATTKILFRENLLRVVMLFSMFGFYQITSWILNLTPGEWKFEEPIFPIFWVFASFILGIMAMPKMFRTNRILWNIEQIQETNAHFDYIIHLIIKLYKKHFNFNRNSKRRTSVLYQNNENIIINLKKGLKREIVAMWFALGFMVILILDNGDDAYNFFFVYIMLFNLLNFIFVFMHYFNSKQWIELCLDLIQWEKNYLNIQPTEGISNSLLERDFSNYEENY